MSEQMVYLNGRIVPADQAVVSVSDAAFLHGASAFTTMLAYRGVVFRLDRHISRLMETVRLLGLCVEATAEGLAAAARELLSASGLSEARMRITLTPGAVGGGGPTTVITAAPLPAHPAEAYAKGISVVVSAFRQPPDSPICGHKTGCYLPRVLARQEAAGKGAEEALWFTTAHYLAEACFCNVFLVLDGKVHTPPRDTPVLPGIVRQAVLELCGRLDIPCDDQTPLTVREALAAEEVFLTSACTGIRPVVRIERHAVGDEKPGDVTRRLMQAYLELLDRECGGR